MNRPLNKKAILPGYGDNCIKVERVTEAVEGLLSELDVLNVLGGRGPYFSKKNVQDMVKKWFPFSMEILGKRT